ncbi:hypothetical protein IQ16_03722 [Bradyrhizobium huanghuaihaiense]|uniref:Uncharacterized protein n=1 Tax=Bradyrhizobium huanghuaihaiense TaxID=990078 RepID=A0A562RNE5_9BRAD|nr:hypothetical protein IQ16_03722 [Bradyrhizobium huanghuaihaiense]
MPKPAQHRPHARARGVRGCRLRGAERRQHVEPQSHAGSRRRPPALQRPETVRKGFFRYAATLEDRLDPYWNGLKFPAMTSRRAQLAAWKHAERIVNREADHGFDYSVA